MSSSQAFTVNVDYAPYFEEQIKIQQEAIISFKRWMVGFVLLGLLIVLGVLLFNQKLSTLASPVIGIGGVFVTSLAAFPYKEITPRRSRIASYDLLKRNFEKFNELPPDDQQKLKDLAIETVKKSL
jgi:ABC-type transport system involved in multi-copper enzyme maturation permease subunit